MWTAVTAYQEQIVAVVLVVLGAAVNRAFRLKAKLVYSVRHSSTLIIERPLLDDGGKQLAPRQGVQTASIIVANNGLQPAKALELTFNWKPHILNVLPPRPFTESLGAHDRYSLKLDSLAPGEQFSIEIMNFNSDLPSITSVRSEDSVGKQIEMAPMRVWPSWFNRTAAVVFALGAATLVYWLLQGAQAVIGR